MQYIRVTKWDEYQHYKGQKSPVWIKLYRDLLGNYELNQLNDSTKWHFIGLLLLAARHSNRIPYDEKWLRSEMKSKRMIDLTGLLSSQLIELCPIEPIALIESTAKNTAKSTAKEKKGNTGLVNKWFDKFWEIYPRKIDKPAALRNFKATVQKGGHLESIISAAEYYASAKKGEGPTYLFKPSNFLGRDEHWKQWVNGIPEGEQPAKQPGKANRETRDYENDRPEWDK